MTVIAMDPPTFGDHNNGSLENNNVNNRSSSLVYSYYEDWNDEEFIHPCNAYIGDSQADNFTGINKDDTCSMHLSRSICQNVRHLAINHTAANVNLKDVLLIQAGGCLHVCFRLLHSPAMQLFIYFFIMCF